MRFPIDGDLDLERGRRQRDGERGDAGDCPRVEAAAQQALGALGVGMAPEEQGLLDALACR
ncbi:MAG: hypothetical protein IPK33_00120 [Gemmatimonadetes bacterium]|nr:hypothetical protein [Gemmatimonadota bacterium]